MQLVAYGAQDVYLTGNPQITFFKVVYRRHTNFSMEAIEQTINGSQQTGTGSVTISRNGDLVHKVYVVAKNAPVAMTNGSEMVSLAELEIGGQLIDRHRSEWMQIWNELSTPESKAAGYKYLTGGFNNTLVSGAATGGTSQQSIMVPLQFYFCRNPGLALPLIALQYHEVKVKFTWNLNTGIRRSGAGTPNPTCEVWADYIYLDTEERRRFAQVSHEYLIEQLQIQNEGLGAVSSIKLNFNHPVKEIVWVHDAGVVTSQRTKLTLNGHDRFSAQDREYFQLRQPLDHHTAVPGFNVKETDRPVMLNTPDRIFDGDVQAGAVDGSALLTATTLTFHANQAAGGTDPAARCRVGDILFLHYTDVNAKTDSMRYYVTVTSLTATVITFAAYVDGAATGLTAENNAAFVATANDLLSVTIVARCQDPQSRCSQLAREVNVYSFALKPEEHSEPKGVLPPRKDLQTWEPGEGRRLLFSKGDRRRPKERAGQRRDVRAREGAD